MSSPSFSATVDLRPRPSLRAVQALAVVHALVVALLFLAEPPRLMALAFAAALLASWQLGRRAAAFGYGPRALTRLCWESDSPDWRLETASGGEHRARLHRTTTLWPQLLVLRFAPADGGRPLTRVLIGDELPEAQLRQLRRRLATSAQPE